MGKRLDYTGVKLHMLTGVRETEDNTTAGRKWEWFCDCGKTVFTPASKVKCGHTKSCGCIRSSTTLNGKRVYGHGISEDGKYKRYIYEGKRKLATREYHTWTNMLERCYSKTNHIDNPSYVGCEVSDNFKNFQFFAEWCNNQIGFHEKNARLDKDILNKGNKLYSEDTCVFVPNCLNVLLCNSKKTRGTLPVGVQWHKSSSSYYASCNVGGKHKHLGSFDNPKDAFEVYKAFKENRIKEMADKHKEILDIRAYDGLFNYKVEITD